MRDTVERMRTRTLGHLERGTYGLTFDGDRVSGRLSPPGGGRMRGMGIQTLSLSDAYTARVRASTCHGPTSCHSHLQSRARQRASGAVRPEAAMRAALLVRGLRRAVLFMVQECLGPSVRPFHTTCIRLFLIFH